MAVEVHNYDEQRGGRWFRFTLNPDPLMASFADEFKSALSSLLKLESYIGMDEPKDVHLHWMEPVDTQEVHTILLDCPEPETQPDWTSTVNVQCGCFWLRCREDEIIQGCTPLYSKGHILVQTRLTYARTLHVIADECYHVFQERWREDDWRTDTPYAIVEREAAWFADSVAILIRAFLEARRVEHQPVSS